MQLSMVISATVYAETQERDIIRYQYILAGTIIYCGLFMRMKNGYMIHIVDSIYDEYVRYIASLFKTCIL